MKKQYSSSCDGLVAYTSDKGDLETLKSNIVVEETHMPQ